MATLSSGSTGTSHVVEGNSTLATAVSGKFCKGTKRKHVHDNEDILSIASDSSNTNRDDIETSRAEIVPQVEKVSQVEKVPQVKRATQEKVSATLPLEEPPVFLDAKEVFCGIARLARALQQPRLNSEGLCWHGHNNKP